MRFMVVVLLLGWEKLGTLAGTSTEKTESNKAAEPNPYTGTNPPQCAVN